MDNFVQPSYDYKECMKMAMLKHEKIFKEQVYELHRLYEIQKMLMKNMQISNSNRHNYCKENICFNNSYQQQQKIYKTDFQEAPERIEDYDHVVVTKALVNHDDEDQEIGDESEIELTLAPTSFNRRIRRRRSMSTNNKPADQSSDSVMGFSSSSTGSSNIMAKVERITGENSSFLSGSNRRNDSSSDRSLRLQPQLMYQVLSKHDLIIG